MTSLSENRAPRKWDAEITTARDQAAWLAFEAGIHQNDALIARVSRALDRYGLGTSSVTVDEALDYLSNKELGASARYFNQTGKAQFNQQQITHAVLSFMAGKEQQRHITDLVIVTDDTDEEAFHHGQCGTHRASHMADPSHLRPDEYAARLDALRAIAAMIPANDRLVFPFLALARARRRQFPPFRPHRGDFLLNPRRRPVDRLRQTRQLKQQFRVNHHRGRHPENLVRFRPVLVRRKLREKFLLLFLHRRQQGRLPALFREHQFQNRRQLPALVPCACRLAHRSCRRHFHRAPLRLTGFFRSHAFQVIGTNGA